MGRTLSLPAQAFILASERIIQFARNRMGVNEEDCYEVFTHAWAVMEVLGSHCEKYHQHRDSQEMKGA
jgi:hypothetical protein